MGVDGCKYLKNLTSNESHVIEENASVVEYVCGHAEDDNPIPCLRRAEYIGGKQRPARAHGRRTPDPITSLVGGVARFT